MTKWKEIQQGYNICPRCKIGVLLFSTSKEATDEIYTCDRCTAKFKSINSVGQ